MDNILLLYLDKLTYSFPPPLPLTGRQICFPAPPDIHFYPHALREVTAARESGSKVILAACGNERKIKESLLSLDVFSLFDHLIIPDEIKRGCSLKKQLQIVDDEVREQFIGDHLFFSYALYFQDFVGHRIEVWDGNEALN